MVKMERTIEYVKPGVRDWHKDDKTFYFAECVFENGDEGSVLTMAKDTAEKVRDAFLAVKDTKLEFELEKGKEYNGVQSWKIKGFPGMPDLPKGGGGARGGGGGMSHAQAGLLAAASAMGPFLAAHPALVGTSTESVDPDPDLTAAYITELADILTDWLFTRRKGESGDQGAAGPQSSGGPEQAAPPPPTLPAEQVLPLPLFVQLKGLAESKGLTEEDIEAATGGKPLGQLTTDEANALIEMWGAA